MTCRPVIVRVGAHVCPAAFTGVARTVTSTVEIPPGKAPYSRLSWTSPSRFANRAPCVGTVFCRTVTVRRATAHCGISGLGTEPTQVSVFWSHCVEIGCTEVADRIVVAGSMVSRATVGSTKVVATPCMVQV